MPTPRFSISSSDPSSNNTSKSPLVRVALAIFFLALIGVSLGRLVRIDSLCHRSLECALIGRDPTQAFRANVRFRFDRVCGDLPLMIHRPDLCVDREEIFITDGMGYRNDPTIAPAAYSSLVFGDSYTYGQGNTQNEIPSMALQRLLNHPVFNGGGRTELRFLRSQLERLPEIQRVYYLHLDRHPRHPAELTDFDRGFSAKESHPYRKWYEQIKIYSPLKIIATRFDRWLIARGILPRPAATRAMTMNTERSGSHLFYAETARDIPIDLERLQNEMKFFQGLKELLSQRGIDLSVVLVPEKYSVYVTPPETKFYFDELDAQMRSAGIEVTNLLPLFRAESLSPGELENPLYWRDDSHWAPRGIRLMAEKIRAHGKDFRSASESR